MRGAAKHCFGEFDPWLEGLGGAGADSNATRPLLKKNYTGQIPTGAWRRRKKFMLSINSIESMVRPGCIPSQRPMARSALSGGALKNQTIHLIGRAANRALLRVSSRPSFEIDSLISSFAVRSGFSLFEKFRSAVRKTRS